MKGRKILKEDGSLNVELINKLPIEEYMETMGDLTQEQIKEYLCKTPINESKESMRAIQVDYTIEEEIALKGSVFIEDFINKEREKYEKKRNYVEVTYDPNQGKINGSTDPYVQKIVTSTNSLLVPPTDVTKTGYDFIGWNTRNDGLGDDPPLDRTVNLSGNLYLYAK